MDEFKKPYEYDEEKRPGLTQVFMLMLLCFEAPCGFLSWYQAVRAFPSAVVLKYIITCVFIFYGGFIIFTDVCLYRITRNAVKVAKIYLLFRAVILLASDISFFIYKYNDPNAIGKAVGQFGSKGEIVSRLLGFPIFYAVTFTVLWLVYFIKSKKIKETYGRQLLKE